MSDIAITAANVRASSSATLDYLTAGATITAGQVVYLDTSDNRKAKLADSNGTSPANSVYGIALNGASSNQPLTVARLDPSFTFGGTATVGVPLYLSNTAGGITATFGDLAAGSTVIVLGVTTAAGTANFNPTAGGVVPA